VQSRLFLDVVVGQRTAIFKLFADKDQSLLVWWDAFLVLDFRLDSVDCVRGFNLKGDCFAR